MHGSMCLFDVWHSVMEGLMEGHSMEYSYVQISQCDRYHNITARLVAVHVLDMPLRLVLGSVAVILFDGSQG